jgi:hypothetical protein
LESLVNDSAAGPSLPHLIKQSKAMRKKKNKASKRVHFQSLPLINPNAAGSDVGAKEHLFKMFYPSLF